MTLIPQVSIIIPNYNGEKYISRCIDSVLNQSVKNIEIIVVDDGSTDNSLECLAKYRNIDCITIITKENGGVSSARNIGIENSRGRYICFLDSDDCFEPNMLKTALEKIKDNDVLIYSYSNYMPDGAIVPRNQKEINTSGRTIEEDLFFYISRTHFYSPVNKLFKGSLLRDNSIEFPIGIKTGEDYLFNLSWVPHAGKVRFINDHLYQYYKLENTLSSCFDIDRWKDQVLMIKRTLCLESEESVYKAEFIVKRLYSVYVYYAHRVGLKDTVKYLNYYWKACYGETGAVVNKGKKIYRKIISVANKGHFYELYFILNMIEKGLPLKHIMKHL